MWVAMLKNGTVVNETDHKQSWNDIKDQIDLMGLVLGGKSFWLPKGHQGYFASKTGSASLAGGQVTIESENIGFELPSGQKIALKVSPDGESAKLEVW